MLHTELDMFYIYALAKGEMFKYLETVQLMSAMLLILINCVKGKTG